jgi:BlaI family penicillinase repressor
MADPKHDKMSRRERQAMDVLYRMGQATAQEVWEALPDRPNYSSARSLLGVLEEKGLVKHERDGRRYVYKPRSSPTRVRQGMLKRLMRTFFDDSPEQLVASLLDDADRKLSSEEAERIRRLLVEHERRIKAKTSS